MVGGPQITITVPGAPVAKGRAKISTFGGHARAYTPAKTRRYEDLIRLAAGEIMGELPPLEGALRVVVNAFVPIPQRLAGQKRIRAEAGLIRPVTRPDVDNYQKAALDGLNQVCFRDDSQVVELLGCKFYSERPRLVVTVEAIGEAA